MTSGDEQGGQAGGRPELLRDESDAAEVADMHEPIYRERQEPRDGFEPTPMWLVFFCLVVVGFAGWYLGMYSGGFSPSAYAPSAWGRTIGPAPSAPKQEAVSPEVLGKRVYNNCMACHQRDGKGVPGNYPPLDGSRFVLGPEERVTALVLHGLQGPVEVEGQTFNQQMPSWAHLTDEQVAAVLTYVRSAWDNKAPPVSPDTVAAVRRATADRTEPWTVAELEGFAGSGVQTAAGDGQKPPGAGSGG